MVALIHQCPQYPMGNKKKSLIGVMMHNKEFFFLVFGWKKSIFLTHFVGMMLIFATVTSSSARFST